MFPTEVHIAAPGTLSGAEESSASFIAEFDLAMLFLKILMGARIKSKHDDVECREMVDNKSGGEKIEYGIVPVDVIASMSGLDFVRAIFARRLPEPPIMQTVEPFDCTAEPGVVVIHSVPGLRHYNPIGSVHGGYAAILLDSAMGLAVQSTLPAGTGYTTLEFKISFLRGMSETSGVVRTEGRVLSAGRRVATAEARITDAKGRLLVHATTTCLVFEIPKVTAKG
jgi:uncharacterized protein (TIGR00369 family)